VSPRKAASGEAARVGAAPADAAPRKAGASHPVPAAPLGRADLHIHTVASDGTAGVLAILDHVARLGGLDVIAITDHERIDAALAARSIAADRGLPFEVVVGEEVSTRGGHLLALDVETRIAPYRSLRDTIAAVHDAGGLAVPAHPLVPYPLCAQGWVLRRLIDDPDERLHPDAIETFNPTTLGKPWHARVVRFADRHGLAHIGNSDAHALADIGTGWTSFPGRTSADLRLAILAHATEHHGTFHRTSGQLEVFGRQLTKRGRDARAELVGRLRRDGTGRDHGYPGGSQRPPSFDPAEPADGGRS
jgi:predicted metal-dependent phosphoesterase TrpH